MARVKKSAGTPTPIAVQGPNGETLITSPALAEPGFDGKLVKELENADREAATSHARGLLFDNANRATETRPDSRLPPMVERVFAPKDWAATFDRYEAWLELGDRRTEEAFIRKAHEIGPAILQALHDSYIQIRAAREDWESENDVIFAGMRDQANDVLQAEKARGIRSKTITEKDIDLKCSSMFHDEWVAQESKRRRYKAVEDRAKSCIEVAAIRCKGLDAMMARLR